MAEAPEPQVTFDPVDGREILEKLARLSVEYWAYKTEPTVRHIGPMAQDFAAAFGLDDDDTKINLLDANGVTMVAVQALYRRLTALEAEVAELRRLVNDSETTAQG